MHSFPLFSLHPLIYFLLVTHTRTHNFPALCFSHVLLILPYAVFPSATYLGTLIPRSPMNYCNEIV
jgi:hypothetical protein